MRGDVDRSQQSNLRPLIPSGRLTRVTPSDGTLSSQLRLFRVLVHRSDQCSTEWRGIPPPDFRESPWGVLADSRSRFAHECPLFAGTESRSAHTSKKSPASARRSRASFFRTRPQSPLV